MNNIVVKLGFTKSKAYGLCGTILMATLLASTVVKAEEVKTSVTAPSVEAVSKTNAKPVDATAGTTVSEATKTVANQTEAAKPVETADQTEVAKPAESADQTDVTKAVANQTESVVNEPTESPANESVVNASTAEEIEKAKTTVNEAFEQTAPTSVTKEGTEIKVQNPEVNVNVPEAADKYRNFNIEYRNVQIPDNIEVNEGDSIVFKLPKEVSFQTNFDFPVTNPSNTVVGHAATNIENGTITTTFNDYFKSNPLNKQISLSFDAKWTDAVKQGEKVKLNFNGTVKEVKIAERDNLPKDQLVAKWGKQSKTDAETINWVVRLNYARKTLDNLTVSDTWSKNQTFVEGSQKMYTVENMEAWTGVKDAKSYLESWNVRPDGFDVKLKTFDKLLYLEYKTKLTDSVKNSFNPTNTVTLNGIASKQNANAIVNLAGGRGNAQGENVEVPTKPETPTPTEPEKPVEPDKPAEPEKPVEPTEPTTPVEPAEPEKPVEPEKPSEPEKPAEPEKPVEPEKPEEPAKPEEPTSEVPGDAPVLDKPEYNEPIGTVPGDAPVLDKPEYTEPIDTTPWDAPVLDKPEYYGPIGTTPWDAPILEKPTLEIPETPTNPEDPEHEEPREPKEVIYREVKMITDFKSENEEETDHEPAKVELKKTSLSRIAKKNADLPSTGEKSSSTLALIGATALAILAAGVFFFHKKRH